MATLWERLFAETQAKADAVARAGVVLPGSPFITANMAADLIQQVEASGGSARAAGEAIAAAQTAVNNFGVLDGIKQLPSTTFGKIWLGAATLGAGAAIAGAGAVGSALPAIGTGTGAAIGSGLVNAGTSALGGIAKETIKTISGGNGPTGAVAPTPLLSNYISPNGATPSGPIGSSSPLGTKGGSLILPIALVAGLGFIGYMLSRKK